MPVSTASRSRIQREAESALAPHPHRIELKGAPNALTWPNVCANCGAAATEQLTVRKVFSKRRGRRRSSALTGYRIVPAPVPFCLTCANEHRATAPPASWSLSGSLFSYLIPIIGAGYFAQLIFRSTIGESLAEPAGQAGWGLFALMIGIIVWTLVLWWQTTKPSRVPPQSEVTRACDFSRDVSEFFERERHIYAMRNEAFADALASLNPSHVWTDAEQARSRRLQPIYAIAVLVLVVGAAAVLAVLRP